MTTINTIQKLSGFGIFRSYSGKNTQNFGKRNLIYGWNGSGKSTLSTLFEALQDRTPPCNVRFKRSEFSIEIEGNNTITSENVQNSQLNIQTFNQSFIRKNINWDKAVKGILLVAQEKIEEKTQLDSLRKEYEIARKTAEDDAKKCKNSEDEISKFLTDSAKRTKISLQVIDTKDSRYLNYNKTKLEDFITANKTDILESSSVLSDTDIVSLTKSARPEQKPLIDFSSLEIDQSRFAPAHSKLNDLLKTSATNAAISRLTNNSDIQSWVANGLTIHANHESKNCEFCGAVYGAERQKELEGHFNDEFLKFQQRLAAADQWLQEQYVGTPNLPVEGDLYEELKVDFKITNTKLTQAIENLNFCIKEWHQILKKKTENQFDTELSVSLIPETHLTTLKNAELALKAVLTKHNTKTENFEKETTSSKRRLELHYSASEVKDFEYFEKAQAVEVIKKDLSKINADLLVQTKKISELENSLSSAGLGAAKFNETLHRFLGRSELSLKFQQEALGYEIIRNDSGGHDGNLSEGEKTAIAFVYFVIKLTENGNSIKNTIVVVDDPVSSFDSNHLFHAYSFLRTHCEEAKQLFVLTHNFNFFKLVRDWFEGVNKNRDNRKQPPTSYFYVIESDLATPRSSTIKNADDSLTRYQSEYHYLFSRLHEYKQKNSLTIEEAFLTANISRKLLETFFTFKYPKYRSDFSLLLTQAQKPCTKITVDSKERIYRFINKYSHSALIDINNDAAENLHGESHSVIGIIFDWIEEVDPIHFAEMKEVIAIPT